MTSVPASAGEPAVSFEQPKGARQWRLAGCGFLTMMLAAAGAAAQEASMAERVTRYAPVRLEADLSGLTENQRAMIPILMDAARAMDEVFWRQAYGDPEQLFAEIEDADTQRFLAINYGPWDRLNDNEPFIDGVGAKPPGARFYPADMTREAFEAYVEDHPEQREELRSLYTIVRRARNGRLVGIPYHQYFEGPTQRAAGLLREAAELAEDPGFRRYLLARADALETSDYRESDLAWMDMKDNALDIVIGPIETYEDQLFGYKAAHEAYVLVKDQDWSRRLARYAQFLPELQRELPVADRYKQETPGSDSDLNAYDVIYYAGDCNAGAKTIAINLPNDEEVQLRKGTRRLQLKNAMQAKYDRILVPIADLLITPDQREHIRFDAFFGNTMFHEVAHGLGIKNTITGRGTVRAALRDLASSLEEGKADILGLYMVTQLHEAGEIEGVELEDYYVTFMAGIFRSVRFGASSAHGRANLLRFNYFQEQGAFTRGDDGTYRVDMDAMRQAMTSLSGRLLELQGDGDYEAAAAFVEEYGQLSDTLRADLDRVNQRGIPVDIVFEQGEEVLGLE